MRLFILWISILFFLHTAVAQTEEKPLDSVELTIIPYGSFRGHFAFYNKEVEFQENASRIGFQMRVNKNGYAFFTGIELGMNLFKSNSQFNADGNSAGGFIIAERDQVNQVFSSRLGYLGVDFGKWGTLSFGKQWSVYYDVTSYTDNFNVFGGQGSATYTAGTDGGGLGTGRADQSVIYRNIIGNFAFGIQAQARTTLNNEWVDGIGLSAQYEILKGLKVGAAFNKSFFNDRLIEQSNVLGLDDNPTFYSGGISYRSKNLDLGIVFSNQSNGDLTEGFIIVPDAGEVFPTVVFDAKGFEIFSKYRWEEFAFLAGYNYYDPDTEDIRGPYDKKVISDKFGVKNFILGMEYKPFHIAYFYAEVRLAEGYNSLGIKNDDVVTMGLRIQLDHRFNKTIRF
ncbi:porin [Namhaeicola litoreus]|uniref:Porin n=1 Tax=Namhaeicola litoreus TaxID=1052145 RepID=A0ABW3Y3Z1_9FLAO